MSVIKNGPTRRRCRECLRYVGVRVRQPRARKPGRVIFYEHSTTPRGGIRCQNSGCHV